MLEPTAFGLIETQGNDFCFDCKTARSRFVSVPNGVFLCASCVQPHYNYTRSVSYAKSLSEPLEPDEFALLTVGGNEKFENFLSSFRIHSTGNINTKYQTKASEYYREFLRSKALGTPLALELPTAEEGVILVGGYIAPSTVQSLKQGATSALNSFLNLSEDLLGKVANKISGNQHVRAFDVKAARWAELLDNKLKQLVGPSDSNN